ncbi:APC family permease [Solwaraspora sp. WMMD1047]|uniref:APC family permease n=1 Tax=Solwaraspora sp. WMMD1047 TaxID=3016102 RepID=UPI0024163087|nr:APC family permease [Solwaraspora sp. WMMD1047]MDG4829997.1 APC family permease [Solwaraspora sp. WMMD1047]
MALPHPRFDPVTDRLAAGRLGVPAVVFFVMSAATPLTVVAGVVATGYATTGLIGIPLAFTVVGVLLAVFAVGFVAMARYMANAGAFYSYIAQGIGRPVGVGAAWVALVAYNLLQVGLYGAVGAAAGPVIESWFGVSLYWWLIALVAWAVTATLGVLRVEVNGRVLAVLLLAEVAVIVVFSLASLAHPAGGTIALDGLVPGNLFGAGVGAVLVLALLGFVGFEAAVVFAEEAKDPSRTIPAATFIAVGVTAVLYTVGAWAMAVATGPDRIVARSQDESTGLVFTLAGEHLGSLAVTVGLVLFATSIAAALISFHNTVARYMFALGRERVLPAGLGRTTMRGNAPAAASLVQSGIGLVVIVVVAVGGWDPLVHLFFWAGTSGGLGVLLLITVTAVAVLGFFARHVHVETVWRARVAPAIALAGLAGVVVVAVDTFGVLLGVPPGHWLATAVPAGYLLVGVAGTLWGWWLRHRRPEVYAAIGRGAKAALPTGRTPRATAGTRYTSSVRREVSR